MTIYLLLTNLIIASVSTTLGGAPDSLEMAGHRALHRVLSEAATPLTAFSTDGCSGGLSSAWRVVAEAYPDMTVALGNEPPWEACCVVHDQAYHAGGRELSPEVGVQNRLLADEALRTCVTASAEEGLSDLVTHYNATEEDIRSAYQSIAEAMYLAVRIGGAPCSGLPWRWGYGSPQCIVQKSDFQASE